MKIAKKLLGAGLLATSALSLASCGGSSSELTIFLFQEDVKYNENMLVYQQANEYAGVQLKGAIGKYVTNLEQEFNLSGKYASVVVYDQDSIEAAALREKIYVDLTDLINQHAPNLKAYFEANPQQKQWATASDGKIYGIPFYTEGETAKAFFVRQDWVDKLAAAKKLPSGIQADKLDEITVEQYEALLKAFKDNASILTKAKTIYPYFDRDSDFAISELASLWGGTADFYIENGQVVYGATQDSFRTALDNIIRWYKAGLIHPAILDDSNEDYRATFFAADQGGSTHDWLGTTYSFNDDCYASNMVDDFELTCILPPTRSTGDKYEVTTRKLIGKVTAISSAVSAEDQVKLVKWIDYFFSAEGQDLMNFGQKDVHYTKTDNLYQFTPEIINDNATALANLYQLGCQLQSAGVQNFKYEEAWLSDDAKTAMAKYADVLNPNYNDLIYPNIKMSQADYETVLGYKNSIEYNYDIWMSDFLKGNKILNDSTWTEFCKVLNTNSGAQAACGIYQKYVK